MAKFKLFLFLITAVVTIIFVTQIIKFFDEGFNAINTKKQEIACSKSNLEILNVADSEDSVIFTLTAYNKNISKITIQGNQGEYVAEFDPLFKSGELKNIEINGSIEDEYYIFIENCKNSGYRIKNGMVI